MDQLKPFGTAIQEVVFPTVGVYTPLLEANASAILSTPKETFSYGSHPRQQVDVYSPSPTSSLATAPILIWFYGGGLVRGDRINPSMRQPLVYANIGHFFASRGYLTLVPDYRLVPESKFPSGGEDVLGVLEWARDKFGAAPGAPPRDVFLMGNSAGGIHMTTFLLADFTPERRRPFVCDAEDQPLVLRGAIALSEPFDFGAGAATGDRGEALTAYYGDDIAGRSPLGLLKALKAAGGKLTIPSLVLTCELDPPSEVLEPTKLFLEECRQIPGGGESVEARLISGHNHISPAFALGTGIEKEEAWGVMVDQWMRSKRKTSE